MDYYLEWDCPQCDATNYYGICRTMLEHNGRPSIPVDAACALSLTCSDCDAECYSPGDFDLEPA